MLVLSRKKSESIIIGDGIEITVVEIAGNQVRLGVTAPRHMEVYRKEIFEAIREESKASAQTSENLSRLQEGIKRLLIEADSKPGLEGKKP